jgi:DnaJ-class molecular chaperone
MLDNVLKQAEQSRLQSRSDGDLEELFEALEITDDHASNDDVDMKKLKRQYRELSVKYHPDKNPDSAQYFNYIRDAYEILSDPVKILLYGTGGQEMVQKYEGGSDELERTDNIERKLHVTLEDAYVGTSRSLSVSRRVVCRSCRLYPNLPRCAKCNRCPGKVELQRKWIDNHRFYQEQVEIPSKEKCIQSSEGFDVLVERGVNTGDTISYQGKASQEPSKIPGDLLVQVSVGKHKIFRRVGNDLQVTLKVSLMEALLGFEREIVHLDGHIVTFGIERGVVLKPGAGFEIEGEGMPVREDPTSFGKMLVRFEIDFPDEVPQSAQADLEAALKAVSHGHHGSARVDYRTSQSNKLYKSEL